MKLLDKNDRYKVYSALAGLVIWWALFGKNKYSIKGMTKNG